MKNKIPLHIQIVIGVILGSLAGFLFPQFLNFVKIFADLFLRLLKMLVIPLIFTSIVSGTISSRDASSVGKIGVKTFFYYIITSLLAILTGQFFVNVLKPGANANITPPQNLDIGHLASNFKYSDILLKIVPDNIVKAMAKGDVLPVIFFALLTGFFILKLKSKNRDFLTDFFESFYALMMKITEFVILLAPYGIFALLYKATATSGFAVFKTLLFYFLTVLAGLFVHFFITLPLLAYLITRKNPYDFMKKMLTPLLTAFSTSSSSATLPLTIQTIEKNVGVPNRVAGFVLPLGATINMDGTALYECVAVIYIAQCYGIHLTFSQQAIVVITSLLVSIGAAGIPMAGLVMMSIILKAVGLPIEGIGFIIAVDRFLDMFRTATNVFSDSTGTLIISYLEDKENCCKEL
ncbi:dicarboxylate/amino acid:cation (Na+ or H+) symporter, DAACS family [Thermotomaculum hydrothermale]|uniref:Dicarboxylate/amino acid:cation (Na+ or H+) symporter, DAACS family n=1 Tax=Thermotomaculum hydrothermale TaxID=981385 RepID=A0A7R6PEQ4_9BACT|nr:dicarboxylate/amino acid:cation symporter [Thermotomaculum hydrothermale]BBB32359.1 dicarboxylate/amino acid:cation (Na+ or H+) symporter, DAACS family [Thermotomaculum hydrothermale]